MKSIEVVNQNFIMREIYVWIDEVQLREYLKYFGKGPLTQDDDFLAALWMKKLFEIKKGTPFTIGFKMNTERKDDLPDWGNATLGDFHNVMRKMRKQNDSVDFALSDGLTKDTRAIGFAFQVKRIIEKKSSKKIAEYINNLWKKYGTRPLKLSLFLIMGDADLDLREVSGFMEKTKIPFNNIFFMGVKSSKVYFGQIYPELGVEMFPIEKFQQKL